MLRKPTSNIKYCTRFTLFIVKCCWFSVLVVIFCFEIESSHPHFTATQLACVRINTNCNLFQPLFRFQSLFFALPCFLFSSLLHSPCFYTYPVLCLSLLLIRSNNDSTPIETAYFHRKLLSAYCYILFIVGIAITPKRKKNC